MGYEMKSSLRLLFFVALFLPLMFLSSCSEADDDTPLSSSLPSEPNRVPAGYLENYNWKRISDAQFETLWDSYDFTVQLYKRANFYQKDKKMGETKLYWSCPIEKTGNKDYTLRYGLGHNIGLPLTRRQAGYDAVFQARENSSLIKFYSKDDDGRVYESVFLYGWLVEINEESDQKSYDELIEYWIEE